MVGAGPTGLGAATRLNQHGIKDWLLIDQVRSLPDAASLSLPSDLVATSKASHLRHLRCASSASSQIKWYFMITS